MHLPRDELVSIGKTLFFIRSPHNGQCTTYKLYLWFTALAFRWPGFSCKPKNTHWSRFHRSNHDSVSLYVKPSAQHIIGLVVANTRAAFESSFERTQENDKNKITYEENSSQACSWASRTYRVRSYVRCVRLPSLGCRSHSSSSYGGNLTPTIGNRTHETFIDKTHFTYRYVECGFFALN